MFFQDKTKKVYSKKIGHIVCVWKLEQRFLGKKQNTAVAGRQAGSSTLLFLGEICVVIISSLRHHPTASPSDMQRIMMTHVGAAVNATTAFTYHRDIDGT